MWRIVLHVCLWVSAVTSQAASGCEGPRVLTAPLGYISYREYSDNADCTWIIEGRPGHVVYLRFYEFDVEWSRRCGGNDCTCDYLEVYKGKESTPKMRLCGSNNPLFITFNSQSLTLKFKSNNNTKSKGFVIWFSLVGKPNYMRISPDEVVAGQRVKCSTKRILWPVITMEAFGKAVSGKFAVSLVAPKTVAGQQEVKCTATTNFGTIRKTKLITVKTSKPPSKGKPHSISIFPDEVVVGQRVNCAAQGYPQPEVRMEAFGKLVNGTSAVSLVVPTTVEGQHEVKCFATNSVGTKKKTKLITVNKNRVSNAADVISMQRIRRLQIEALEMQKKSLEMQMKSLKIQIKSLEMQIKARKTVIAACTKIN